MTNPAPRRTIHPFADQGKFTAVHNSIFDVIMPGLPPNAFKVLCFVIRKTVGWKKESDQLSYSQIAKGTGIKSPATLRAAVKELLDGNYIIGLSTGKWDATNYRLNADLEIEIPTTEIEVDKPTTDSVATSISVVDTATEIEVAPTTEIEDTKERLKEKKESVRSARAQRADRPPAQSNLDSLHEAVKTYKQLTGSRPPPTIETLIASTVIDDPAWQVAIKAWCGRGFKPSNAEGMIDWYLHPEKQQQRGTDNGNSKHLRPSLNGHSERGKLSEADPERGF